LAIAKLQNEALNKVDELVGFMASNPTSIAAIAKRVEVINFIRTQFVGLTSAQLQEVEDMLTVVYKTTRADVSVSLGQAFDVVSDEQVKALIARPDKNLSLSQRIYRNNEAISTRINNDLGRMIFQNANPEDIKRVLKQDYGLSYNAADRLIRTEASKLFNTAAVDSYRNAGITQIEYLAEDDACEELCQPNDGKIFDISNPSVVPPLHPNCRCTLLPVIK
jgi:SPP1 gp7 family putative phage head morphogenesis protein